MQPSDNRNYEHGYELAFELAAKRLTKAKDLDEVCQKSGALLQTVDSGKRILIDYLNQTYHITVPEVTITLSNSKEPVAVRERILILDYLIRADGKPLVGELITYKDLPEGMVYFPTFYKRTIKRIIENFGIEPDRFIKAGEGLGGKQADYGDASITIKAFPCVAVTFVLWRGDSEFPAEGNILFDRTISGYLSTEDINVLCEMITWKLIKLH